MRRFVKSAFLVLGAAVTVSLASAQTASAHDWLVDSIQGPSYMPAGGIASYVVGVRNTGVATSPTSTLFADIPAGTTFIPSDIPPSASCEVVGDTVQCPLPAMAEDEFISFTLDFLTEDDGVLTFGARVPSDDGDTDPENNSESITTTITRGADLQLEIEAPVDVVSGDGIDYILRITNAGPHPAEQFTVNFPAPEGVANLTAPSNCILTAGTYSCQITEGLALGADTSLTFSGQAAAAANSTITVQASISGQSPADPFSDNDVVEASTEVNAGSDLAISKTRTPGGTILQGSEVVFTLTGSYTGEAPAGQITITDELPEAYTYIRHEAPAPWNCDFAGRTLTCTQPAPDTGAGADVGLGAIQLYVEATDTGTPVNTADITAANTNDPNPANNSASVDAEIEAPFIDLAASKSGPRPALVVVGREFEFTLGARNLGNAGFTGTLHMTDIVPEGMTISAAEGAPWQCGALPVIGPDELVCSITYTEENPLPALGHAPALILTATSDAEGLLRNAARVSAEGGNYPDENSSNDTATYDVSVSVDQDSADISVEKTATRATLPAGEEQTFHITVRNAGPDTALNVDVTDLLTGLINTDEVPNNGLVSAEWTTPVPGGGTPAITTTPEAGGLMLHSRIPALPVCDADCPVLSVTVIVGGDGGARSNTATAVSQTTADPNWTNTSDSAAYVVESRVDVTLHKEATPSPASVGQPLSFILTATNENNGLSRAHDVTVTDTLPHGLMFLRATPSTGSCSAMPAPGSITATGNDQITCNLGSLNNGAQQTVQILTRPMLSENGQNLVNTAEVTTATTELDYTNNDAEVTVNVTRPFYDLIVSKTDTADPVSVGDETTYRIMITNNGPSAAENVVMTDTLPADPAPRGELSFLSWSGPSTATCSTVPDVGDVGGELVCTIPYLPSGSSSEFTVTMRGERKGSVTNHVAVTANGAEWEINAANNTASQNTTVRNRVDLEVVSKTAVPGTVALREDFVWNIVLRNNVNSANQYAEADDVVFTDNLPAGMVLTGAPVVTITTGTISNNSCTGAAGGTSVSCNFGTMSSGAQLLVTLPVRVMEFPLGPIFGVTGNAASIATSSDDRVESNNTNTGPVTITAGSISGSVWRDFNEDGARDTNDSGVGSIALTLTGTDYLGNSVTMNTTTAADGSYDFGLLPRGEYTITRTGAAPAHHEDLAALAGSAGGDDSSPTVIADISLAANADITDYDFTLKPIARLGLAKSASTPVLADDGSFTFNFQILARNYSLEPLNNVTITDGLSGPLPGFGTYNANAASLQPGEYHAVASSACGTVNTGFNGESDNLLLSGLTLQPGLNCTVTIAMTVRPDIPLPYAADEAERYINQATVTGVGAWSGQDETTNTNLSNLSHNGTNPDPNGNGVPGETGEVTPTPVGITYTPEIAVVKEITGTALSTPVVAGDTVTYAFTVTNTGNVPLVDVTLDDPKLPGEFAGVTIALLMPGESDSTTFGPSTYTLTSADVAAGVVENQATTTGTWAVDGSNNPVTVSDLSGTTVEDDDPTILTMGAISLVKTAVLNDLDDPVMAGDVLRWSFTVTNNGAATLEDVMVSDTVDGVTVTGGPITLLAGESDSTSFTAEYTLTQADIDAGSFTNAASVIGYYGEDGGDRYPVEDDDTVTTPLPADPQISLIKTADDNLTDPAVIGQQITYSFTIENTGNVTLSDITLADLLDGIDFTGVTIATLAPGGIDTDTFSATYAITQADIDRGFVVNEATVTGNFTDADGTLHEPQDTDDTRTEVAQDGEIVLVKTSDNTGLGDPVVVGDEITYAFAITNTGNVTLTNVTLSDDIADVVGGPIASLAPGITDDTTFTATYAVTAADIEAGFVNNTALTTGTYTDGSGDQQPVTDISGTDVGNDTPTTTDIPQSPAIALIKRADVSTLIDPTAGDLISYTFEVVNTGNVTLTNMTLSDDIATVVGGPIPSLAPGGVDTGTFTATYAITQDDLDRGYVDNTAIVTGTHTDPQGVETEVSDDSGTDVGNDTPTRALIDQQPELELVKTADATGVSDPAEVGQEITWTFTITNTGNVTLSDVDLTDTLDGIVLTGDPIASLAPGGVNTDAFSASYTLTQEDLDRGFVENFATVTGSYTDPDGDPQEVDAEDGTSTDIAQDAQIELIKTADVSGVANPAQVGNQITWSFTITNTGNVTLTDVMITEALDGVTLTGGPITLAPNAVDTDTFSATYVLTQADLDAGFVENLATVTGEYTDGDGDPQPVSDADETRSDLVQNAQITLLKEADASALGTPAAVGDEISYTFTVTNTGNVTLSDIILVDTLDGIVLTGSPIASLAPEGVDSDTFTAVYTLTQADLDRGFVDNLATVTGHYTDGENTPQEIAASDDTSTDIMQRPALELLKEADTTGISDPAQVGEVITYAFTITNTGNVTLTDITLADTLDGIVLTGGPIASLAPQGVDSDTFTASYTLTQADLDRGFVENFATVTGIHTDPEGDPQDVEAEDEVRSELPQEPLITLVKEADATGISDPAQVGEEIIYSFTITNTGNVTLSDVTLTDTLDGIVLTGDPIASLAPGDVDSETYSATYALTQADLDAGFVANHATVTGSYTDPAGNPQDIDAEDDTRTDIAQDGEIVLVKTSDNTGLGDPVAVGDEITYAFAITNTGNVTLTNVTLSDDIATVTGGPIAELAPGATDDTTFTAVYAVTAADIEAGFVDNTALTTGTYTDGSGDPQDVTDISGTDVGNDDPTRTEIPQNPAIALIKTADDSAVNVPAEVGDIISYSFEVVNTGNVTLTNITLEDLLPDIAITGGPVASLAPGDSDFSFTATYALKQTDLNRGYVENTATVTGTHTDPAGDETEVEDISGTTVDDDTPTRVDVVQSPGITLVKIADDSGVSSPAAVGDTITYSFHIRNSGSITLTDVTLADDLVGIVLSGGPIPVLEPGDEDTTTFTATYDLTQADIDHGSVENTATATGNYVDGDGTPGTVSDISGTDTDNDTETVVLIEQGPAIALVKTADDSQLSTVLRVGDELRYNFAVTNTGNVTLTDITLTDDLPGIILSGGPIASLAPGVTDSVTFTAVYYLTADDLEAQQVTNSALVTGVHTPPSGDPEDVTDISGTDITNDDPTVTPLPVEADVTASKTASTDRVVIGDTVTYTLSFTNESPRSLRDVIVVDRLPEGTVYTPETALVGGVAEEPEVSGPFLRWQVDTIAAGATLEVQVSLRITGAAPYGPLVNQTWMVDETGSRISNIAEARVLREPEHVFECTDIIGTVFDDRNMNGYQDPIDGQAHGLGANAPEPGVAGVRLVTPNGTIITTDEFGRFHVPCAELPRAGGSNFTLKLDTRSLPSGYRVTTENPRTIRVTAGRMAKLNFGVAIAQVVRLDLSAAAFNADGTPSAALAAGIKAAAAQVGDTPVVVRLSYRLPDGGDARAAWRLIDQTEEVVRREWRGRLGPLLIERTIQREE